MEFVTRLYFLQALMPDRVDSAIAQQTGEAALHLGAGAAMPIEPTAESGSGQVQEKSKVYLSTPSRSRPKFSSGCSRRKKIARFSMAVLP